MAIASQVYDHLVGVIIPLGAAASVFSMPWNELVLPRVGQTRIDLRVLLAEKVRTLSQAMQ